MATLTTPPVEHLVPHARPMLLLDRYIPQPDERGVAEAAIRPGHPFLESAGVPAMVALEYLAQTVAAFGGYRAFRDQHPPRGGFLLGTPKMTLHVTHFELGQQLRTTVEPVFEDEELLRFHGVLENATTGAKLAEGDVTIFQPKDMQAYMDAAQTESN